MVLFMPSPYKPRESSVYWCRQRVPAFLAEVARGKIVSVTISGKTYALKLGDDIKVSLSTKDPREAKERAKEATAEFDLVWASLSTSPLRLSKMQCVALSKDIYDFLKVSFEEDPEAGLEWQRLREEERRLVAEYQSSPARGLMIPPRRPVLRLLALAVDHCLGQRHLTIDEDSRDRLMFEFDRSFGLATELLARRSDGDYGPDENEKRFPAFVPTTDSGAEAKAAAADVLTLTSMLKHKAKSQTLKAKTVTMYEAVVRRFREFAGHEDARKLTSEEGRRWREHLVEAGLSKKTINDKYITSIKTLLTHAVDEFDLPTNPVSGLRDKRADASPSGPKGYTVEQAQAILQATFGGTTKALSVPHKRAVFWVPWICAYTGLRVSEVTQLRGQDLRWDGDIPYLAIPPLLLRRRARVGTWSATFGTFLGPCALPTPLRDTVFSAHPLTTIDPGADRLLEALTTARLQQLAWTRHGCRRPARHRDRRRRQRYCGAVACRDRCRTAHPAACVMLALLQKLAAS